jgi:hypothetical protein
MKMTPREKQILSIARAALKEVEQFRFPAFSDREGEAIARGRNALRQIVELLAQAPEGELELPPTALPVPQRLGEGTRTAAGRLAEELAGLGYPGFAHLRGRKTNPATFLLNALVQPDLDARLAEALPWVVLTYPDLAWGWLLQNAKLRQIQNRLGFIVSLATNLASTRAQFHSVHERLSVVEQQLEHTRLVREDTLGRESMTTAERNYLEETRSPLARHWNLVTGMTPDQLPYATLGKGS